MRLKRLDWVEYEYEVGYNNLGRVWQGECGGQGKLARVRATDTTPHHQARRTRYFEILIQQQQQMQPAHVPGTRWLYSLK